MLDSEILDRLAVIEDWHKVDQGYEWTFGILANPLENDAQAMDLIKRYNLYIEREFDRKCEHDDGTPTLWCAATPRDLLVFDESLNRAICLAIIKAHE